MKVIPADRDWFACFCMQSAANVFNKDGQLRFHYDTLSKALHACENRLDSQVPHDVVELFGKIVGYCNSTKGDIVLSDNEEHALLLTLLNIQVSFVIMCGLWKVVDEDDKDEYGFEIF